MVGMIKKEFPAYNVSELILDYRPRLRERIVCYYFCKSISLKIYFPRLSVRLY